MNLFSTSQQDAKRTQVLVQSLRSAFGVQSRALSDLPFRGQSEESEGTSGVDSHQPVLFPEAIKKAVLQIKSAKILAEVEGAWRIRIPAESLFLAGGISDEPSNSKESALTAAGLSTRLDEKSFPALDALGLSLREAGASSIRIEGHALEKEYGDSGVDSVSEKKLWQLSFERAYALGNYWSHRFEWPKTNFEFLPRGSSQPVLDEPTASARVELVFKLPSKKD